LEGSPQGNKAKLLRRHFETLAPAMDTRDFEACVAVQADALASFRPDVLVASSFGAAVAVELLQRGLWRGATLLLAQAALRRGAPAELPPRVPIWLVHGLRDDLIDIEESRRLAAAGSPEWVVLHEVDDDHPLHETVASGRLVELVRALAETKARRRSQAPSDATG
jgi:predicted esterase